MEMFDVTSLGELLIDFTPSGSQGEFIRNPGGAPANVLAALARLGRRTGFIGKVGDDQFGRYLKQVLDENDIDTGGLLFSPDVRTTLAFVHLDAEGDRSFSFYRNPGADMMIEAAEVNKEMVKHTRIFHFGSLSLTDDPARGATLEAVRYARECGTIVSYDPNYREKLWKSEEEAVRWMKEGMRHADIVKLSEEEFRLLAGDMSMEEGSSFLADQFAIPLLLVTLGSEGSYYRYGRESGQIGSFKVDAADSTGAGDCFMGSFLHQFLQSGLMPGELNREKLEDMVLYANAAAALSVTGKGAIPSMPRPAEIEELLKKGVKS